MEGSGAYVPGARVLYTGPKFTSMAHGRTLAPGMYGTLVEHRDYGDDDPHWVVDWDCPEGTYRRILRAGWPGHRVVGAPSEPCYICGHPREGAGWGFCSYPHDRSKPALPTPAAPPADNAPYEEEKE